MMKQPVTFQQLVPRIIFGVGFGIVIVALFLFFSDLQQIEESIRHLPLASVLAAVCFTFMSYGLRFLKWQYFFHVTDLKVTIRKNMTVFLIGLFLSITPGKIGELVKSYVLERDENIPYARSIPIIFYDRLTDLLAMLGLIGVGFLFYPLGLLPFGILVGLLVLAMFFLPNTRIATGMIDWFTRPGFMRRFRGPLLEIYDQTLHMFRFRVLGLSFGISVLAWLMECISLYMIFKGFDLNFSFAASIFIFSVGTLAGALSMLPGGLGAFEGSTTGLLIYFGLPHYLAVTISLVIRLVTLWLGVLIGLAVFLKNRRLFM